MTKKAKAKKMSNYAKVFIFLFISLIIYSVMGFIGSYFEKEYILRLIAIPMYLTMFLLCLLFILMLKDIFLKPIIENGRTKQTNKKKV